MADEKQTQIRAAYEQFKNCLYFEDMLHKSWPMALVGGVIGGVAAKLPGAVAGGLIGFNVRAVPIAYRCLKDIVVNGVEDVTPPDIKREVAPPVQASR